MRILVVGSGAREHALLWKLRQDAPDAELFIAPGNGGTSELASNVPIPVSRTADLARWAMEERIDLTIVGPEIPLADGIVDTFGAAGAPPIFGPTRAAAEIESSKAFAKGLMKQYGIPTADFEVFTDADAAEAYIRSRPGRVVVKASGLAAGKGAVVCTNEEEAVATAREILTAGTFGEAGSQLVVEEFMEGEELSVFAVCDGEHFVTLPAAQDHKAIGEGDTGPNTGGMGAYAPVSLATPEMIGRIEREIIGPTLRALAAEGRPYRGFLYAGLMLTSDGPRVVEFNARFGDPEAQVVLPLLTSSMLDLVLAAIEGRIDAVAPIQARAGAAVTTVIASGGYPGSYETGRPIEIDESLAADPDVLIFHAGTAHGNGRLVTAGGRVLSVTALGDDVGRAAEASRAAAEKIAFEGSYFRRDIAWREIQRT